MRALVTGALLASASVFSCPRVASATEPEAVHLRYTAPDECPAEGVLVSYAEDMGGTFRLAPAGSDARSLDVLVEKTVGGFSGTLAVRGLTGDRRVRKVTWTRCDSVVRALGLFVAIALEVERTPVPAARRAAEPLPAPEPRPAPGHGSISHEPAAEEDRPDDSGGIAVMSLWGRLNMDHFGVSPVGAAVTAVADFGGTRLGVLGAVAAEDVQDPEYVTTPNYVVARGHGQTGRLGVVAGWGAPWSREAWVGVLGEAGVRGGVVNGAIWPLTDTGTFCASAFAAGNGPDCVSGPGTKRTWMFASPYLAGTAVLQMFPKLPVRPFLGFTVVWSGDYRGNSNASSTLDVGLAWRAW